jgi:Xaa-Pro dipeptidase
MSDEYVRFSPEEFRRRYREVGRMLEAEELDAVVVFGWSAMGRAVQADVHYLTGYLGMRDNYVLFSRDAGPVLFVQSYNHVPNATEVAAVEDVRWGGANSGATVGAELRALGHRRIGVVGMMPYQHHQAMVEAADTASTFVDATRAFRLLRTTKSEEELAWLRAGAEHTDRALDALRTELRPGLRERELGEIVDGAIRDGGGMSVFHYIASTPMSEPRRCVPSQVLSERQLRSGDVVTVEISAAHHGYAGQGLRTFVVAAEPTERFRALHDCAEEVFAALTRTLVPGAGLEEVLTVADGIDDRGFTIRDALLHGFGMGLLPPSIGTRRTPWSNEPWTFELNQTIVVQPNIVTADETAGVQTGELCVVTSDGLESLHHFPLELVLAGG